MAAFRAKYRCLICRTMFIVNRVMTKARCGECGSLKTERLTVSMPVPLPDTPPPPPIAKHPLQGLRLENKVEGPAEDRVSRFACVGCARQFEWNHDERRGVSPYCTKCKSSDVIELTPRAAFVAMVNGAPQMASQLSRREIKRIKFIRRQWKLRCRLREWIESGEQILTAINLDSRRATQTTGILNAMLAEIDEKQMELHREFEAMTGSTP